VLNEDDGSFVYTPTADFNGVDFFTYVATDAISVSNVATVIITVTAINDAPSFTKGPDQAIGKRAGPWTVEGWAADISPGPSNESGQTLTFTVSNDNNVLFLAQPDIDEATGDLTFEPDPDHIGTAIVTVILQDSGGTDHGGQDSVTEQFTIDIEENTAPFAKDDLAVSDVGIPVDIYVLDNDSDPDGDPLSIGTVGEPDHGTVEVISGEGEGDYIRYILGESQHLVFTYTVSDGSKSTVAQVWVYVSNHPPDARDDETCTHRAETRTINVLKNDTDPDGGALQVIAVGTPPDGAATIVANRIVYTPPDAIFTGTVVFTYTMRDDGGPLMDYLTDTAVITIHVEANRSPIANDDIGLIPIDASLTIHVLENDDDPDIPCHTDYLTVFTVSQPLTGSITWDDTTVTYIPPSVYTGAMPYTATFPYTITDNANGATGPLTSSAWITIVVIYPVGGYTEMASIPASLELWVVLILLGSIGVVVAAALKRHRKRERAVAREGP
jgi:hypothetical protein